MLLVDHADTEAGELDVRLDQRMGTDHEPKLAGSEPFECLAAPGGAGRAGDQREGQRLGASADQRRACCSARVSVGAINAPW